MHNRQWMIHAEQWTWCWFFPHFSTSSEGSPQFVTVRKREESTPCHGFPEPTCCRASLTNSNRVYFCNKVESSQFLDLRHWQKEVMFFKVTRYIIREDKSKKMRGKQSGRGNLIILQLLLEILVMCNTEGKNTEHKTKLSQNLIALPLCLDW